MDNKVTFGVKNVNIHPITDSGTTITYATAIPWLGATEMSLDPAGDRLDDYADNGLWFSMDNNQGFTGKFSVKQCPYDIASVILGDLRDSNGVIAQSVNPGKSVAVTFQFEGDKKATRHILYNVIFSRTGEAGTTKSDKLETATLEFDFTAGLDPYLEVAKAKTDSETKADAYENWFKTPYRVATTTSTVA